MKRSTCREEVAAIKALRDRFTYISQSRLADRIVRGDFSHEDIYRLCGVATNNGERSRLSVYSVIRRYDASRCPHVAA